jgi:hypothetical protein
VVADEPAVADESAAVQVLAEVALAEPAAAAVERDVSQAGSDELEAGQSQAGCPAVRVESPAEQAESLVE